VLRTLPPESQAAKTLAATLQKKTAQTKKERIKNYYFYDTVHSLDNRINNYEDIRQAD